MKRFPGLLFALAAVMSLMLTACSGTNATPYNTLDQGILADQVVVTDATTAVGLGLLSPADASAIYQGEVAFTALAYPALLAVAEQSAAPTLAQGAVTLAVLQADEATLVTEVAALHNATTAATAKTLKAKLSPKK